MLSWYTLSVNFHTDFILHFNSIKLPGATICYDQAQYVDNIKQLQGTVNAWFAAIKAFTILAKFSCTQIEVSSQKIVN